MRNIKISSILELKAYSIKELATIYQVDRRTFKNWIIPFNAEIGERRGRYYTVNQVKIIVEKLGMPGEAE